MFETQEYIRFFKEEAALLQAELRGGHALSEVIGANPYYLPELYQIILFGQSNGRLGEELIVYSEMLIEQAEEQFQRYVILVQPVLFAIVGSIVLFLFLSVMIPVFRLFQSL